MKKHKTKLVAAVLVIVVLAVAFFMGSPARDDAEPPAMDPSAAGIPGETPVRPEQAPAHNEPASEPTETGSTCTVSISCAAILNNMEDLDPGKEELIPADGWILQAVTVELQEGESVFDLLQRVCREQKIHLEYMDTPMYDSAYIEGIANLYEYDCGPLSGWMYKVNDWFPNYGCSRYQLQNGDTVCWVYTCDLGSDVGNTTGGMQQ